MRIPIYNTVDGVKVNIDHYSFGRFRFVFKILTRREDKTFTMYGFDVMGLSFMVGKSDGHTDSNGVVVEVEDLRLDEVEE